jgi:Cdc6-like AAA superfamily ATPase
VPFDRNPNFTGREPQLARLEDELVEQSQTTKVADMGLGGVGKTQLTLEFVYRVKNKHRNCSVIWLPATNPESLYQAYQDVARHLRIVGWEEDKADIKRLVQNHLSKESSGQWLLVFDNTDNIDLWFAKTPEQGNSRLIDYLPRSKHRCIIFTTRDRKTAVKLAQKNVIYVWEIDKDTATHLL